MDGSPIGDVMTARVPARTVGNVVSLSWILDVSADEHTFNAQWYSLGVGIIQGDASGQEGRTLTVKEFLEV